MNFNDDRFKLRNKTVLSPIAQSKTLCDVVGRYLDVNFGLSSNKTAVLYQNEILTIIIYMQIIAGLRISEVLNFDINSLSSRNILIVPGSKGSKDIVIRDPLLLDILYKYKLLGFSPFDGISRFYVYREYKKMDISAVNGGKVNVAVTHSFRHKIASDIRKNGISENVITIVLNHNSTKSKNHYGNK